MSIKNAFSFLIIGKTQETKSTPVFKNYVGVGSSYVLAVNPTKTELENLTKREVKTDPEYLKDGEMHVHFLVKTDPELNNGIEIINRLMFTLKDEFVYNRDQTSVQVTDQYGNFTYAPVEDVEAKKPLLDANGKPKKIDTKYRKARVGEEALVDFLKKYLSVPDAFDYANETWTLRTEAHDNRPAATDCKFAFEKISALCNGDVSEIKQALQYQPNNKVKLLYGVRTDENNRHYQVIASRTKLFMYNNAGKRSFDNLEKELKRVKEQGAYSNVEFKVQPLQEYTVEASNLTEEPFPQGGSDEMPWD